ncbi:hypothetical protein ACJIZ3_025761 [Penstemon smallii]|uniref:Flavonoid-6-hydroxylase n=1 Tax=Penstemon smallii TaxID=265156 RepID=A0ABD3TWH3_9LAMI
MDSLFTENSEMVWYLLISFSLALVVWLIISRKAAGGGNKQPPGPPGWPLIGNILDVGMMPHQSTHKLKAKYGPVLWLKLGMSNALVIQSAKTAEELFKKHDLQFSDRKVLHSFTACDHDKGSFAVARYGDYWRMIRKLCATDLLSQKRINGAAPIRQDCVDLMMQWIREDSAKGSSGVIQLEKYLVLMTFNVLCKFVISKDVMGKNSEIGHEFHEAMTKYLQWSGTPNLVDSFPFLKPFDPQGIKRNAEKYLIKLMDMVRGFIKERVEEKLSGKHKDTKDFLDALLENDGKGDQLSEKSVIFVILEMLFAGTETTSSTIEWGMAELLHNPDSLRKLKEELDVVIGRSRKLEEGDVNKLPYLQAVVKEAMRLHPTVPFLLPRNSMEDTNFMGYFIPKDTMVLVNAWSIQRDPDSWEDPLTFKPERFIDSKIDSKGQNFELIPFGSGRRSCIGMLMGEKMVSLTLGRLIHEFDWKLPPNVTPQTMDMREKLGISLNLLDPFKAIPVQRN